MGTFGTGISDNDTAHDLYGALRSAPTQDAREKLIGDVLARMLERPGRLAPDRLLPAAQQAVAMAALVHDRVAGVRKYTGDLDPETAPLDVVLPDFPDWSLVHWAYAAADTAYQMRDHPNMPAHDCEEDAREQAALYRALADDLNAFRRGGHTRGH